MKIFSESERLSKIQSALEWVVAAFFLVGGISLFFSEPVTGGSALAKTLGSETAGSIYGILFIIESLVLIYSKRTYNKKIHGVALVTLCLTALFTVWLEALVIGFGLFSIDNIVIVVVCAWAYIRWRLLTAYLDPQKFVEDIDELDEDAPPSRRKHVE